MLLDYYLNKCHFWQEAKKTISSFYLVIYHCTEC